MKSGKLWPRQYIQFLPAVRKRHCLKGALPLHLNVGGEREGEKISFLLPLCTPLFTYCSSSFYWSGQLIPPPPHQDRQDMIYRSLVDSPPPPSALPLPLPLQVMVGEEEEEEEEILGRPSGEWGNSGHTRRKGGKKEKELSPFS